MDFRLQPAKDLWYTMEINYLDLPCLRTPSMYHAKTHLYSCLNYFMYALERGLSLSLTLERAPTIEDLERKSNPPHRKVAIKSVQGCSFKRIG